MHKFVGAQDDFVVVLVCLLPYQIYGTAKKPPRVSFDDACTVYQVALSRCQKKPEEENHLRLNASNSVHAASFVIGQGDMDATGSNHVALSPTSPRPWRSTIPLQAHVRCLEAVGEVA